MAVWAEKTQGASPVAETWGDIQVSATTRGLVGDWRRPLYTVGKARERCSLDRKADAGVVFRRLLKHNRLFGKELRRRS
jgi:hypothetical protein